MQWMIYGANGYSAQLIAEAAVDDGLTPVLAGRNQLAIKLLSDRLGLKYQIFDLSDAHALDNALTEIDIVLNCAGPFSETANALVTACLKNHCHYLDITGEIQVFEWIKQQHQRAKESDVILCPGVGFDVIPTDCLAAQLHARLPDATELSLAFDTSSGVSPGTAKTSVESLKLGGMYRQNGQIKKAPFAHQVREITTQGKTKHYVSIPWGDVSTAYVTTGIPNITCYASMLEKQIKWLKRFNKISWLLKTRLIQNGLKRLIGKYLSGPTMPERETTSTYLWGEVKNNQGQCVTGEYQISNGYTVTVEGALAVTLHLLENKMDSGFYTPSQLMGPGFAESLPGSTKMAFHSFPI